MSIITRSHHHTMARRFWPTKPCPLCFEQCKQLHMPARRHHMHAHDCSMTMRMSYDMPASWLHMPVHTSKLLQYVLIAATPSFEPLTLQKVCLAVGATPPTSEAHQPQLHQSNGWVHLATTRSLRHPLCCSLEFNRHASTSQHPQPVCNSGAPVVIHASAGVATSAQAMAWCMGGSPFVCVCSHALGIFSDSPSVCGDSVS